MNPSWKCNCGIQFLSHQTYLAHQAKGKAKCSLPQEFATTSVVVFETDPELSVAHTIRNILQQVNSTTISIGHSEGHFISTRQVAVLEDCADSLEHLESVAGIDTPTTSQITQATTEEDGVRARQLQLAREIKAKRIRLTASIPANRSSINTEINQLLSEQAKLAKLIKQFETATLV